MNLKHLRLRKFCSVVLGIFSQQSWLKDHCNQKGLAYKYVNLPLTFQNGKHLFWRYSSRDDYLSAKSKLQRCNSEGSWSILKSFFFRPVELWFAASPPLLSGKFVLVCRRLLVGLFQSATEIWWESLLAWIPILAEIFRFSHYCFSVTGRQVHRQNVVTEAVCCGRPLAAPSLWWRWYRLHLFPWSSRSRRGLGGLSPASSNAVDQAPSGLTQRRCA